MSRLLFSYYLGSPHRFGPSALLQKLGNNLPFRFEPPTCRIKPATHSQHLIVGKQKLKYSSIIVLHILIPHLLTYPTFKILVFKWELTSGPKTKRTRARSIYCTKKTIGEELITTLQQKGIQFFLV